MQNQTVSTFIPNGQQKKNPNQTTYNVQKKTTITRSETSDKVESSQSKYRKRS